MREQHFTLGDTRCPVCRGPGPIARLEDDLTKVCVEVVVKVAINFIKAGQHGRAQELMEVLLAEGPTAAANAAEKWI